jgi:hypothetical protein
VDDSAKLNPLPEKHDFFIGINSDGCAFDSMVAEGTRVNPQRRPA